MSWAWDQVKNEANLRKHGLGFEAAILVFDDPVAATQADPYPHEQRWRTIGLAGTQVVMAVHTWPDFYTGIGRIISAGKAIGQERKAYEEGSY